MFCHLFLSYFLATSALILGIKHFKAKLKIRIVDCRKKYIFVVRWAQMHNQSLAAIADEGLARALHFREESQTELPSLLHCTAAIRKEFLKSSFYL